MRWCFEDDAPYAHKVLAEINAGETAHVPFLWLYEVIAVTAESQRAGILTAKDADEFFEDLRSLGIEIDTSTDREHILSNAHRLAIDYRLSGYDAVYLELALRKNLPLASLDKDLNKAALRAGVPLFSPKSSN
jgi:predicted nucleic acid-binding protein